MSGTKAGGIKARNTNYKNHGEDFYKRIGTKGGRNGHTGGFASNPELARTAGAKGGRNSKRGKTINTKLYQNADRIIELIEAGVTFKDIASLYNVPYYSFRYWLKKEYRNE